MQASRPLVLPLGDPVGSSIPSGRNRCTRGSSAGTLRTLACAELTAERTASVSADTLLKRGPWTRREKEESPTGRDLGAGAVSNDGFGRALMCRYVRGQP